MFQLVRRPRPATPLDLAKAVVAAATARERFLSRSLIALLSVNIFMVSGVFSFCLFTFWYTTGS